MVRALVSCWSLSLVVLAACAGGEDPPQIIPDARVDAPAIDAPGTPIDATDAPAIDAVDAPIPIDAVDAMIPIDASTGPCNPLAPPGMMGCAAGQKCTWIEVQELPTPLGRLGCVPDGTVATGGACTSGPPGDTTGFDDCAAGNICAGGTCRDICGFDSSAQAACATGYNCTRYSGLFANGEDDPIAGACNPSCDPITQTVTGGGMCPAGNGCYTLTSATTTIAVCAGAGTVGHGQPITGQPFANSCLPGHAPRRPGPGATTWECGALCRPAPVTSTTNMGSEGGVAPYTCEARGAAPPASALQGESCRYFWAREPFDMLSPFSNTVGFCWKHAVYQYDTNGDMTPDAPFPRCITLTTGDVVPPIGNPPHNDAEYFWCVPLPSALTSFLVTKPRGNTPPDRVADF